MSQYVREWVMTIVFLVAASAFFEGIFPGGSMGKYLKYIFALIILSVISFFYAAFRSNAVVSAVLKGMQAGVAAVIADVVWSLGGSVLRSKSFLSILIMAGAFAATYWGGVNVVWIILVCGALGAAQPLLSRLAGKLRRKDGARP